MNCDRHDRKLVSNCFYYLTACTLVSVPIVAQGRADLVFSKLIAAIFLVYSHVFALLIVYWSFS